MAAMAGTGAAAPGRLMMSAPHDPGRIGELWNADRLAILQNEIEVVRDYVTLSGGWAWHFMTPPGHAELKHAHDHKDADLFVEPQNLGALAALLKTRGFEKTWTRFDDAPGSESFYRYVKSAEAKDGPVKVMFDLFAESVPCVEAQGFRVVEPNYLLSLYGKKHSSDLCFSVRIARRLVAQGVSPVGHPDMADYAAFLKGKL
jgi:hypothetical protein